MLIKCDHRYTYECDIPVKLGDRVLVSVSPEWQETFGQIAERTVTSLESDYKGPCQRVLEVIEE